MAKNNDNFFKQKKEWSFIKDELLEGYLQVYFTKVLTTRKPIVYVDCFAGLGKFESGEDGSPIIALKARQSALSKTTIFNAKIDTLFIDPQYAEGLSKNISIYKTDGLIKVKNSTFENEIDEIIDSNKNNNLFLYIDPFGIKSLDFEIFTKLSESKNVEFLLNLNSFGFLRAGFRALKLYYSFNFYEDELISIDENIDEFDDSVKLLDKIAGGNYWQDIIIRCKNNEITTQDAEKEFSQQYINQLKKYFTYVLNMPIKLSSSNLPKYRMVHVSNHKDGCYLMAEDISRRTQHLVTQLQNKGQGTLFDIDGETDILNPIQVKQKILSYIEQPIGYTEFVASFFTKFGVVCTVPILKELLNELEKEQKINIKRIPQKTKTGRIATFWSENKNQSIILSKVNK